MSTSGASSGVSPGDVAVLLRARTKDSEGREVGVFNEDTRPSLDAVEQQIALAEQVVRTRIGGYSEGCSEAYATAVVFTAACQIEKSYFPEQVRTERSPYEQLASELELIMTGLLACVEEFGTTDESGEVTTDAGAYDIRTPSAAGCVPYWPEHILGNWNPPEPTP